MSNSTNTDPAFAAETKMPQILGFLITGAALSTIGVVLRVYTRARIIGNLGADDWVMVVAQVLAIASCVAIGLEGRYGLGRHFEFVSADDLVKYFKAFYASVLVYNASLTLVKISILLQYRRIFPIRYMQRASMIGLVFITLWGIANLAQFSMLCIPIQSLWDHTIEGKCLDRIASYYAPASINIFTDFAVFALPLPVIKSLQLARRPKIILYCIFGIGFFTCSISLIRLSTLYRAATSTDQTWENTDAAIWSFLELGFAIFTACLPTLRPLVTRLAPRFASGGNTSSGNKAPDTTGSRRGIQRKGDYTTMTDSQEELHQSGLGNGGRPGEFAMRPFQPAAQYTATVTRGSEKAGSTDGDSDIAYENREHGIRKTVAYVVSDAV